ncbi:MAG TPA: alpha amylase C-terminal domain-containing protein, partial [Burkholderiales bacterium]|nr:alpha amylase C-terminal domain-containing protein [Burkholderiales bacterium]
PEHGGLQRWLRDLNRLYRAEPALHQVDFGQEGFEWIEVSDAPSSVLAFLRKPRGGGAPLLVACNFTPLPRKNYRLGVPSGGRWRELLNSDAREYGGSGWGNLGGVAAVPVATHSHAHSIGVTLPPLAALYLKCEGA